MKGAFVPGDTPFGTDAFQSGWPPLRIALNVASTRPCDTGGQREGAG